MKVINEYRFYSLNCVTIFTIYFLTFLTIAAELFPGVKNFLGTMFIHHWIGKGVLSLLFYGLGLGIMKILKFKHVNLHRSEWGVIIAPILASVILFVFYIVVLV